MKRLAIWLFETSLEVVLLALALVALFGHNPHMVGRSLIGYAAGLALVSFTTGYLLTTAIARSVWKGRSWWVYSVISIALFLVHSEIFFVASGGSTRPEQFSMQVAGTCVVFACTVVGTLFLRRWSLTAAEPVGRRN